MKTFTPEISWHGRDPIYSVDFQLIKGDIQRFATCGTDRHVRIWELQFDDKGHIGPQFLSSLTRHTRTVNVVRFSPCGEYLASAGDDSAIIVWRLNETAPPPNNIFAEEEQDNKEIWSVFKVLRSHLEDVYDLSWSTDGRYMLSGSVDNSAIYWDVRKAERLGIFPEHKSFVQGVAFDPLNTYLATMSADRCCRIYSSETKNCKHVISRITLPCNNNNNNTTVSKESKTYKMFHDDTIKSFFRRLSFSPDGQLLLVPAGCMEDSEQQVKNVTYIFSRNDFTKPVIQLPGYKTATLAVRFCPLLFKLRPNPRKTPLDETQDMSVEGDNKETEEWQKYETLFCLPYRMIFAVASEDAILLYDTQQSLPFAYLSQLHYHTLSDLAWSADGNILAVSSTDGYMTFVTFSDGELGTLYEEQVVQFQSREEIRKKEVERQQQKEKKKKAKEEEKIAKKTDKLEITEKDNEEKSANTPEKHPASTAVTTPSSSQTQQLPLTSPHTPRRVAMTTLKTYSSGHTPQSVTQVTTPKSTRTPKRVELTTLTSYKQPESSDQDNSNTAESDLHLQLETTCDSEPSEPSSVSACNLSTSSTTLTPITTPTTSCKKKAPRRVQITTLSSAP